MIPKRGTSTFALPTPVGIVGAISTWGSRGRSRRPSRIQTGRRQSLHSSARKTPKQAPRETVIAPLDQKRHDAQNSRLLLARLVRHAACLKSELDDSSPLLFASIRVPGVYPEFTRRGGLRAATGRSSSFCRLCASATLWFHLALLNPGAPAPRPSPPPYRLAQFHLLTNAANNDSVPTYKNRRYRRAPTRPSLVIRHSSLPPLCLGASVVQFVRPQFPPTLDIKLTAPIIQPSSPNRKTPNARPANNL
jgi:hypothetical protein